MAEYDGPAYLRAVRGDLPILYREDEPFPLRGSKVVRRPVEASRGRAGGVGLSRPFLPRRGSGARAARHRRRGGRRLCPAARCRADPGNDAARPRGGPRSRGQLRGRARQRAGRGVGRACGAGYSGKPWGAAPPEERPHRRRRARIMSACRCRRSPPRRNGWRAAAARSRRGAWAKGRSPPISSPVPRCSRPGNGLHACPHDVVSITANFGTGATLLAMIGHADQRRNARPRTTHSVMVGEGWPSTSLRPAATKDVDGRHDRIGSRSPGVGSWCETKAH